MQHAFLSIDTIKGESHDDKHKDWIEIQSFSQDLLQPRSATASTSGGTTAARVNLSPIEITKTIDYWQAETPKLRAQAEALEVLLHEAAGPDSRGASLEQSMRQTLDGAGLKDHYQLQQPDEAGPESWRLTFEQAPADAVVGWLLGAPRQLSLQVVEARLQRAAAAAAQDSAGTLSGTVRMDQAQGAKEAS